MGVCVYKDTSSALRCSTLTSSDSIPIPGRVHRGISFYKGISGIFHLLLLVRIGSGLVYFLYMLHLTSLYERFLHLRKLSSLQTLSLSKKTNLPVEPPSSRNGAFVARNRCAKSGPSRVLRGPSNL